MPNISIPDLPPECRHVLYALAALHPVQHEAWVRRLASGIGRPSGQVKELSMGDFLQILETLHKAGFSSESGKLPLAQVDPALSAAASEGLLASITRTLEIEALQGTRGQDPASYVRILRLYAHLRDANRLEDHLQYLWDSLCDDRHQLEKILATGLASLLDDPLFHSLGPEPVGLVLNGLLEKVLSTFSSPDQLRRAIQTAKKSRNFLTLEAAAQFEALLDGLEGRGPRGPASPLVEAIDCFFAGQLTETVDLAEKYAVFSSWPPKPPGPPTAPGTTMICLLAVTAIHGGGYSDHLFGMQHMAGSSSFPPWTAGIKALAEGALLFFEEGRQALGASLQAGRTREHHDFILSCTAILHHWAHRPMRESMLLSLREACSRATAAGLHWLADTLAPLVANPDWQEVHPCSHGLDLLNLPRQEDNWARVLRHLSNLDMPESKQKSPPEALRLVWVLDNVEKDILELRAFEQRILKSGKWSKGTEISVWHLAQRNLKAFIHPEDEKILATIKPARSGDSMPFSFDMSRALPALVGNPRVFHVKKLDEPVQLSLAQIQLFADALPDGIHLHLSHDVLTDNHYITHLGQNRWEIVSASESCCRIAKVLGKRGQIVPPSGREQLKEVLAGISGRVLIHAPELGQESGLKEIQGDPAPILQLSPSGDGLLIELLVRPIPGGILMVEPGVGRPSPVAHWKGTSHLVQRNLEEERGRAEAVVAACPALQAWNRSAWSWDISEPTACLEALEQIHALEGVAVEWPAGERFRLTLPTPSGMTMRVRKERGWFEVKGKLTTREGDVLDMALLLEALRHSRGRFVPLGEGRFLALTEKFRRNLRQLSALGDETPEGLRLHPLSASVAVGLLESMGQAETDEAWKDQIQRFRLAENRKFSLPRDFRGELREYQEEGYSWLCLLAEWGAGACLADDMGLGKTVQALALILSRANQGPTLVVAPTSVTSNWQDEAQRFTPRLRLLTYEGPEREGLLENLGPRDLVITSYTLLQQEEEKLASIHWQTVVLDEAQSIKNAGTRRARAARRLTAEFRLAMTGTPIENHLGELWSIFRFLNPGLLGSPESFSRRFTGPIEKHEDKEALQDLKRLIRPFILRRLKGDVLSELPPRTEITLHVEMGEKEAAFYEALRQSALNSVKMDSEEEVDPIRVLAAIMRLRRACCHPGLVAGESAPTGAKLARFAEVLEELREGGHRALVFSQFVDFLSIVRKHLDRMDIPYCYLDGSTPSGRRRQEVADFQQGKGDLFLISLKAGGFGLNLTAADYVIHLDPWWNPAVEAQASDRAHRIGQERPVTIYRLVNRNTIEEKILALHREKRDLADGLLTGSDRAARLSARELLRLIREP